MKRTTKLLLLTVLGTWMAGSAWAIEPVDGIYKIGSAQDWAEFCTLHNDGTDQRLNAELTADVTVEGNVMVGINGGGKPYRGIFDGKGHTLTVAYDLNEERVAPFRRINGATIKNLIVRGTINTSSKLAAGLVGGLWQNGSLIQNCVSYVVITDTQGGDATHGGICGSFEDVNGANTIENCAFLGEINASNREGCGGIVGWTNNNDNNNIIKNCLVNATGFKVKTGSNNDIICRNNGNVENCYYIGSIDGIKNEKNATAATDAQAQSGELCFKLNGSQSTSPAWFQTIGTDNMPSPIGTAVVYAIGTLKCNGDPKGEVTYSNTAGESVRDSHNYNEWGFCSVCNDLQMDFLTKEGDYYLIATKQQYNWFMYYVNNGHSDACAKLTQDLDLSDYTFVSIGNDANRYHGTFDGQGFRVKNMSIVGTTKELGFFSVCSNATIKNLILDASCVINSGDCTGGLIGCCNGSGVLAIENVGIECDVKGTNQNCAAFVGCNYGGITIQIKNCYNTGNVTGGRESAIFSGWFGNNGNAKVENCWSTGKVNGQDGQNSFGRGIGASQFVNSYDLNSDNNGIDATKLADYTSEWLTNGKLTYILNGNKSTDVAWYQTIGTDAHPMLFGSTGIVYANGSLKCDGITPNVGSELTFSNTEGSTIDSHQFANGFCSVCDSYDPDFMTASSGYYEVTTGTQLRWTAVVSQEKANAGIKVKLMNDLNMEGIVFDGFGSNLSDDNRFKGEIDGQLHKITNLKMNADREGVGLVNTATVGAKIKNLTMASSCDIKGTNAVAAFIGAVRGSEGELYIENCGNEGAVTASGANGAGFVGCKFDDNVIPCLTNCYNVGVIHSGNDGGSFSGWMPKAKMVNCYSIVSPDEKDGDGVSYGFQQGNQFSRGWSIELTNCYDFGTGDWGQNNGDWGNCFKPGAGKIAEVNETEMGRVFAGLFDAEGGNVWHMEYDGWAHPVLYDPAKLVLSENVPNRYVNKTGINFTLKRTLVKNNWNTICLPFDLTTSNQQFLFGLGEYKIAELTGIDNETLQFTTVSGTMTAGKPYLVMPIQDVTEKLFNNIDITAETPTAVNAGDFTFTGIFEPTLIAKNDLFVAAGNKLQPSDGTGKLKGFRAYFKTAAGARATSFVVDGGTTTGIIGVDGTVIENGKIYNLNGQKVQNAQKGLYIVNGKKVVVK